MQGRMAEGSFRHADHTLAAYFSVLGGCFENLIKFYSFNFVPNSPFAFSTILQPRANESV